jgi:putative Ca2+/H+ antiporter (TMEM165/GDT1 family)
MQKATVLDQPARGPGNSPSASDAARACPSSERGEGDRTQRGVFLTTLGASFSAEIGDNTQIATLALAAGYSNRLAVVSGPTLGMVAANAPADFLGNAFAG